MQGRTQFQAELSYTVNLDDFVPQDHLLRKIDGVLDLDFVYELTSPLYCTDNGQTSIDPVLFFRLQIIGYLYGIKSDRKLCEEINLNLAYRRFCRLSLGDRIPDHWSLTRIRQRFRRRQSTRFFKAKLTERAWKVEGLFGEAKDNHCLRRTKYRGMANAQIQFYLTALTQNLKRVVAMKPFLRELTIRIANMASSRAIQGFFVKIDNFYQEFLTMAVVRYTHWKVG